MLHACDQRFDVTGNLEKFLRTKQGPCVGKFRMNLYKLRDGTHS